MKETIYYTLHPHTREVLDRCVAPFRGGQYHIPSKSLLIEPLPKKAGFAAVANEDFSATEYIEDHRGKEVYCKKSLEITTINELGAISHEFTEQPPMSEFDVWNDDDNQWVTDESKKLEHEVKRVDSKRRQLYQQGVDSLLAEANLKRLKAQSLDEPQKSALLEQASAFEQQALALRDKIQAENPWPV